VPGKALPPMVAVNSEVRNRFVSDHSGDECSVEDWRNRWGAKEETRK